MRIKQIKNYNIGGCGGFTLVEMMVSMAIFLLAMGVVMQLFFFATRAHRIMLAHSQIIGEMSYNLEHISRGLRMAKKSASTDAHKCLSAPGLNFEKTANERIVGFDATNVLTFQNYNAAGEYDCIKFGLYHPADYPEGVMALMEARRNPGMVFRPLPLTSPSVNVLAFSVIRDANFDGWDQNDDLQPRVTIFIKAQGAEGVTMENQVTVSQRDIDFFESAD